MAVTGRTSSFSESRFFELLTAATTPASQAKLRRSISGEKYQRVLTSGSGASLLPCDATLPRRNTPPRNNNTSAYRFNSATATGVPPIEDILQSLRRLNADVQICHASSKRKESRPLPLESMREFNSSGQYYRSSSPSFHHHLLRSPSPREPAPIIPDPVKLHRASTYHSHHHCNESEAPQVGSTAAMDPSLTRMEVGVECLGRLVQSAKNQVETILSQVRELSGEFLESSSPQLHHHREHVYHQEIPEASVLPVPLFKQLVIKSIEIVEPALIVQDPVDWREDVDEVSGQKLQEVVAHRVFEEMPQPATQTFDDEDEGAKSQETEATSKDFPEATPKSKHSVLENHEEVQDCTLVFPVIEIEELSYVLEIDCKLEIVVVALIAAHFFQVIRPNGADKERMGVG